MSVSEAAVKALAQLQEDPNLAALAEEETETMAGLGALLQQKDEGVCSALMTATLLPVCGPG